MDFTHPIPGTFLYLGWNIDLRTAGPSVRPSNRRALALTAIRQAAEQLDPRAGIRELRLFETSFVPPLRNAPHFDVILLANTEHPDSEAATLATSLSLLGAPLPNVAWTAANVARFGDTDTASGPVLLNHFTSARTDAEQATATWKRISRWYHDSIGVTNSTLLRFDPDTPYLVTNYAVIPTGVARFMANQLLRPSFYRNVARPLNRASMQPYPVFAVTRFHHSFA